MKHFNSFVFTFFILAISIIKGTENYDFQIVVDFSKKKLLLSDVDNNIIKKYPVALPRFKMKLPIIGEMEKIIINPYWYPTRKIRQVETWLPKAVPPGDKLNAMGKAKIIIRFISPKIKKTIRIHGTNKPESIGQRVTSGCIRLKNKDILDLAKIIEGKKVKIIFTEKAAF